MTNVKLTTDPLWKPRFKDPMGQQETAFMARYYDDVEGMIATAQSFDWQRIPHYRFQYQVGPSRTL